jgi:hypothetical protein
VLRGRVEEAVIAEQQVEVSEIPGVARAAREGLEGVFLPGLAIEPPDPRREDSIDAQAHQRQVPIAPFGVLEGGLAEPEARHHIGREQPFAIELAAAGGEGVLSELDGEVALDASRELLLGGGVAGVPRVRVARREAVRDERYARRKEGEPEGEPGEEPPRTSLHRGDRHCIIPLYGEGPRNPRPHERPRVG